MLKELEIHRRANIALQSLSPEDASSVRKAFSLVKENANNLTNLRGKAYKFIGGHLPPNTYMIDATPSPLRVLFEKVDDEHILIQDVIHRDWFTLVKKDDK
jgi:mRNA-degrading endonuclease RelE of RelBE toxin-antitoxin system